MQGGHYAVAECFVAVEGKGLFVLAVAPARTLRSPFDAAMCSAVRLSENVTSGSMPACSRRLMYMTLPSVAAAQSSMAAIRLLSPSDAWASRKILMHWSWPFCKGMTNGRRRR
eukprot:356606-Chlamydomonas_euryale.AAC.2